MKRERMTPEDIQRILSGTATDERHRPLAVFVQDLRRAFTAPVDPFVRDRHHALMAEAFANRSARARGPRVLPRPTSRRVLVAAACFVGGVFALAAAGSLGPAQSLVANAVAFTGLDLPGASDEVDKGGHDAPQGEAGKQRAASNREFAGRFTTAKKAWTSCVGELAKQHEDGEFDPEADPPAGCGAKPHPSDFRNTADDAEDAAPTANPAGKIPGAGNLDDVTDTEAPDTSGAKGKAKGLDTDDHPGNPGGGGRGNPGDDD